MTWLVIAVNGNGKLLWKDVKTILKQDIQTLITNISQENKYHIHKLHETFDIKHNKIAPYYIKLCETKACVCAVRVNLTIVLDQKLNTSENAP